MQSFRILRTVSAVTARSPHSRAASNIAGGSMGRAWADKEHAAEAQYFNKKDADTLAQLADKLKNHTQPTELSRAQEKESLSAIFAKHNTAPSDALLEEIVNFKFNQH